jgi:DNA-binding SARP family transcriptional activator
MVRRLVIPIESATVAAVTGVHARSGWAVTESPNGDAILSSEDEGDQPGADEPGIAADPFSAALVHSKVRSPAIRPTTLERPRLLSWLEQHASARLRVITAEAGYGKSTLLADHARRTAHRTIWYQLESSDRDWVTFLSYLVAAVREIAPAFGAGTVALLQQVGVLNPTRDVTVDTLLGELESVAVEPLILILDDFHTVQESDDVRAIVLRLLEHAPAQMSLVISGRDRPTIPMARLAAQDRVAELATEDLRFTRRETADLFAHSYGTPIDDDLVRAIDERLEGWGASLQLVCASLLSLRPEEIRTFVRDLSAHSDPLYEFLAEEVLSRQTPVMRRVLMHCSLLERISPHLVVAATADPRPVPIRQVSVCLYRAEDAGLVSRAATGSGRWRFHPLVREFLQRRLLAALSDEQRVDMHLRIAVAAEASDWLAAIHHYLEAGCPEDGMRVLRGSAIEALGTASWGEAMELVDRAGDQPPLIAAAIIQARAFVAEGQPDAALGLLDSWDLSEATGLERSLVNMTKAAALFAQSRADELVAVLKAILDDDATPNSVRGIAEAWIALINSAADSPLRPIARLLRRLAAKHKTDGLAYFAGISLNNAMGVELARGEYDDAIALGRDALGQFASLAVRTSELASLHSAIALGLAEAGNTQAAWDHVDLALSVGDPRPDALGECAWLAAVTGRIDMAWSCLNQAQRVLEGGFRELGTDALLAYARVVLAVARGDLGRAEAMLGEVTSPQNALCGDRARRLMLQAMVATAQGRPEAAELAQAGLAVAKRQGAWRWEPRLRLLLAAATTNRDEFTRLLSDVSHISPLTLLELADVVVDHLDLVVGDCPTVENSVQSCPERWLPSLRRSLSSGQTPRAHAAAQLLARFGTRADLVALSAWEQTYARQGKQRVLSGSLSRRVTPKLQLRDLGRTEFAVDSTRVLLSQVRRKAAALLLFLASRPGQSAGRELVLDELWPEASPQDALNSLHQAMYYLRRCIDQWYEDSVSADYIVLESEIIYLDPGLASVDSVFFHREAAVALSSDDPSVHGSSTVGLYRGMFAPEFEYEEWAIDYRGRTHAQYLRLVQAIAESQLRTGNFKEAATGLTTALGIDPGAFELEVPLVKALWSQGSRAAALEHYRHYAHAHARELGIPASAIEELLKEGHRV